MPAVRTLDELILVCVKKMHDRNIAGQPLGCTRLLNATHKGVPGSDRGPALPLLQLRHQLRLSRLSVRHELSWL